LWVPVDARASQLFQGGLAGFVGPSILGRCDEHICTEGIICLKFIDVKFAIIDENMGRTTKFIESSKDIVRKIQAGKISSQFLDFYSYFAKGRCAHCKNRLYVTDVVVTGSGKEYQFRCGHGLVMIDLHEVKSAESGGSYSKVGINDYGVHDVRIEVTGAPMKQDHEEIAITKLLCHYFFPSLSSFTKDEQYSSVDVIARSKDKTQIELFQITKINDEKYWTEINNKEQIEKLMPNIVETVQKAIIKKKQKYADKDRQRMILLIDARPGVVKEIALVIVKEISVTLKESGFKQIWIVGKAKMLTHRLL